MPLSVIALIMGALLFAGTMMNLSHREWISVWRGHRIKIKFHHFKIFVEVDGVPIFEERQGLARRVHETEWAHPALGKKNLKITKIPQGQDGLTLNLEIGDEIVPLFEIPRTWYGHAITDNLEEYWKKLMPIDFEQLGDPRWIAACKILQLVRQSQMANPSIREAANTLQQQLRKNFETRVRLAEEDFSVLGEVEDLNALKSKIEERILQGLEAVKSLHMVTISLEAHADESEEMDKVNRVIGFLEAEDESEQLLSGIDSSSAKNRQRKQQAQKKKL